MGLDISYYSKIDFASSLERDDAEVYLYNNDMVFGQSDGIKNGAYDSYGEYGSFRAGSYSGYNQVRVAEAKVAKVAQVA